MSQKRNTYRLSVLGIAALTAAFGLAACSSSSKSSSTSGSGAGPSTTSAQRTLQTVRLSEIPVSDVFAPDYAVQSGGYFAKYGVNMSFVDVESGSALVTSLEAGTADLTQAPISVEAEAIAKGAPITIFAAAVQVGAGFELEVKAGGPYQTIQSLKGQTIGISAAGSLTAQYAALTSSEYGLGAKLVPVGASGQMPALLNGQVAASVLVAPQSYTAVSSGQTKVLINYATSHPVLEGWAASTSWLNSHRQLAIDVLKGYYNGLAALDKNSHVAMQVLEQQYKETPDVAAEEYKYLFQGSPTTPTITAAEVQANYDLLSASGTDLSKLPQVSAIATSAFTSAVGSVGS